MLNHWAGIKQLYNCPFGCIQTFFHTYKHTLPKMFHTGPPSAKDLHVLRFRNEMSMDKNVWEKIFLLKNSGLIGSGTKIQICYFEIV